MSSEVGSRIARNSIFSIARTSLTIPITILITPFIIRNLGNDAFGIWALVGVISSYAQLSEFGITESLIKFVAEYKARQEILRLNQLLNTAMVLYLILGLIFCSLFIGLLPLVVENILNVPPALSKNAQYVFKIAILLFFLNMLMGVFGSLIIGFQRMGCSNFIGIISVVLSACGTVFFLLNGYGLNGLIYTNVIITGVVISANIITARYIFPQMRINPFRYFSTEVLRQIFGFSWKVQISNITQLMIFQVDRVLLSHYISLAAVSHYEIANRIASNARGLVASTFSPMIPAASTLHAVDDTEKIAGLYRRSFKYLAITAIPFSFLVIGLAHPFVRIWMGPGYEISAVTIQLLMFTYMLNLLTGPGSFILSGINKPQVGMKSSMLAGITNIVMCLFLVRSIGYYGVIIGISTSIITSGIYFIWMVHRNISGLSWRLYRQTLLRPCLLSFFLTGILIFADSILILKGYPMLCLVGAVYMTIVIAGLFKGDYLDEFDRSMFARLMPFKGVRS